MPAFTIRTATMDDLAAVDALLARAYPRLLKPDYAPSVLVTVLPLISRAQPDLLRSGSYYVAEAEDGAIVGCGGWTPDKQKRGLGHIRHVASDDRRQRQGIGQTLITHSLRKAKRAGVTEMECWSTFTGVRFYEALGFRQIGPIDVPLRPGITFPSIRMLRSLDDIDPG